MTLSTLPAPKARLAANVQGTGRGGGHDINFRTLRAAGATLLDHFLAADGRVARFADDRGRRADRQPDPVRSRRWQGLRRERKSDPVPQPYCVGPDRREGEFAMGRWFRRVSLLTVPLAVALSTPGASATGLTSATRAGGDWRQFGSSPAHTGVNPTEDAFTPGNVKNLHVAWRGVFGSNVVDESSPVIANGIAYVAGFDGKISAFDAAGCGAPTCSPLWQGQTGNDITATPAVASGRLLVASADHFLYAFPAAGCGAATCQPLWRGRLGDADVDSSVAVAGGLAYVGAYNGKLYAFRLRGCGAPVCRALWIGITSGKPLTSSPAVGHGSVFVSSNNRKMYVFPAGGCGADTCQPSWTAEIGGPAFTTSPTVAGDTVFAIGTLDRRLHAFRAGGCGAPTCEPLWNGDVGATYVATTPAVSHGMVYVASQGTPDPNTEGVVSAFPVQGCGEHLCEPAWTGINFASGFESSPAVAGNIVFVAKGPASGFPVDAGLYAFDVRGCGPSPTCSPIGFVRVGTDQFYLGSSVAIAGGQLMFASEDNSDQTSNLYVLSVSP
jgi:outer membrane protein assembly factor BamB